MSTVSNVGQQLDKDAERILNLAVEIGSLTTDTVYVNFSRLLLALVFARTPVSAALRQQIDARRLRLDLASLLRSQGAESLTPALLHELSDRTLHEKPSDRPLLSDSATRMLTLADEIAGNRLGPNGAVGAADILTAYLFRVPPEQAKQMEEWNFRTRAGAMPALLRRLAEVVEPVPLEWRAELGAEDLEAIAPVEGYDAAASAMLRLAWFIGGSRPGTPKGRLNSNLLMIAAVEAAPLLRDEDRTEVALVRDAVHRSSGGATYVKTRDSVVAVPSDLAAAVATTAAEWPDLTQDAQGIIETARLFAAWTTGDFTVAPRHLIAALLLERDGANRAATSHWMQLAGVPVEDLHASLAASIQENHPTDNLEVWNRLLVAGDDRKMVATLEPDTIPADPRVADMLGLRRYADAMAGLIASRDQKPPLSIAVFGPWGSGKSFFMAMLRAAVRSFAQPVSAQPQCVAKARFLQRIVQIEFNAWHYVEGNLWASLVYAILETLQAELSPHDNQDVFQNLVRQLSLSQAAEEQAQLRLQEAEQRQAEARAALRQAESVAVARRAAERAIAAADVLEAFRAEALERLRPDTANADIDAWVGGIGDSVVKAANYLGRPELADTVPKLREAAGNLSAAGAALTTQIGDVETVLEEANAAGHHGASLLGWLANARFERHGCVKLAVASFGLFIGALIIAATLQKWGAGIAAAVSACASLLLPLVTALAALVAWARGHLASASKAFAVLDSLRSRLETARGRRLSEHELTLQAALHAASEAEAEAARRRAEYEAATVARQHAEEQMRSATGVEQMKQFIAQRLAEGDYLRHLGLLHTIRADMRRLELLLCQVHARTPQAEPPVERIVLYIDDLDRCPPKRVVEVLEAVHLLLAFPLFVVVVGVDVRWVKHALRQRYPQQLGEQAESASPIDYLEKVFQIPFWLPPMDGEAGRRLLAAVLPPADESGPEQPAGIQEGVLASRQPVSPAPSAAEPNAGRPLAAVSVAVTPAPTPTPTAIAEALTLSQRERERLLDMAEAVGASPRRAKRFANLYLLFKASLAPSERRDMERRGGLGRSYIAAMMLLAGVTGAPRATGRLLQALMATPALDEDASVRLKEILAGVCGDQQERAAFAVILGALAGTDDEAATLAHLRTWAPRVCRFLFDQPAPQQSRPPPDVASLRHPLASGDPRLAAPAA